MYYGWLHKQVNPGFADTWLGRLTIGKDGKPLPEARTWKFHTPGEVIDAVETFLERKIALEETINLEVGFRIK